MNMHLNFGSADVDELEFEHDGDFGFTVVFDNGNRLEVTYETDPVDAFFHHAVICSMYGKDDGPLLQRAVLHD